jgi:DNA mismatch repair protein MutS2
LDDRDLQLLEFHKVREILAGFTSFSGSRELALNLSPMTDGEQVALRLQQSAEARRLLSLCPDLDTSGVSDVRGVVRMASRGKVLEPLVLLEIRKTLDASRRLRSSVTDLIHELPLLGGIASEITDLAQLEHDIGQCLSPGGEVLDNASPRLASVRQRMRELRQQLLTQLEGIVRSPRRQKIIQEPIITEREGRFVIPIKSEWRREMKGIVHDVSNTGATLFIEPWTTLDMGNELRELIMEEKHEVERILVRLSSEVGAHESDISRNIDVIAEMDLALAKAKYAREARATEPIIVGASKGSESVGAGPPGSLRLVEARHPLLANKAVPLSVEIGRHFRGLVITGPNTGGKTVALKTIGLLSLMVQAGLPIPARAESTVPLFDGVFADIGDEQSIEQTLSTFSWHIGNIVRIIDKATEESLVLLDELGTNTDPGEGSALARSILLHLLSQRTMTVATTHYTELKALAHNTEGLQNASLDVDPVTMAPTYHLTVGVPGGSNALATASRLGLAPDIIDRARGMLAKGAQELEALLTHLMTEQNALECERQDLEKQTAEVRQRNVDLANRLQQLDEERGRIIKQTRDEIMLQSAELQRKVREATSELRKQRSRESIEQAKKVLAEVHEQLSADIWKVRAVPADDDAATRPITAGDTVWIREAGLQATVLSVSPDRGLIEVHAGKAKMTLSMGSVNRVTPFAGIGDERRTGAITHEMSRRRASLELDLRGKRAEEVELAVEDYLNEASLANLSQVRIIHGIGTGTVRQIVRDLLSSHPLVTSFRPGGQGEGGDGVTIVSM